MLACFFVLPRDISLPLFLLQRCKFSGTHHNTRTLRQVVRCFVCVLLFFGWILHRGTRKPRSTLGELFYIHAINVSAQTHTGARRALASFVVWDAPDCSKKATCSGRRGECISLCNDCYENDQIYIFGLTGGRCFASFQNLFSSLFMLRTAPVTQLDNRASVVHMFFSNGGSWKVKFQTHYWFCPVFRTVGGFLTNKDLQLNDSSCQTKVWKSGDEGRGALRQCCCLAHGMALKGDSARSCTRRWESFL